MKDIDFDELDKAVNSLMGGLKDESDVPQAKTLNISSTLKDDEKPEYSNIEEAAKKIGNEAIISPVENTAVIPDSNPDEPELKTVELAISTPATAAPASSPVIPSAPLDVTTPPVAPEPAKTTTRAAAPVATPPRPQTGRFMDVMHPSAAMKPAQDASSADTADDAKKPAAKAGHHSSKVSHFGATLQAPDTPASPSVAAVSNEVATANQDATPLVPSIETSQAEKMTTVNSSEKADNEPIEEPLSSPFLPDAKDKVEKRPLGNAATTSASKEDEFDPLIKSGISSSDAQLTPDPDTTDALPEELNGDLLAIETNFANLSDDAQLSDAAEQSVDQSREIPDDSLRDQEEMPKRDEEPVTPPKERYEEHPSVDDQPEGAIFDTSAYQQSVNHPAKSTPAWLWIVVIIVIIIVCAVGAAAFYLVGSQ